MGLFGPSIPSLSKDEIDHMVVITSEWKLGLPEAGQRYESFLSMMERIFIRRQLMPKYGDQAGPRFVRSYVEAARLLGDAKALTPDVIKQLTAVSNSGEFSTRGHGIRYKVLRDIWREWFGNDEADKWYKEHFKEYLKTAK